MSQPENFLPLQGYQRISEPQMLDKIKAFRTHMAKRRTVRDFSSEPVDAELIRQAICIAGLAPSGANHQPWHFAAISNLRIKRRIRQAAEAEEQQFYHQRASEAWLEALEPLGTDAHKPFLEEAPWLIAVFVQRRGGERVGLDKKNYYIIESVGLATGFLITALHQVGLAVLTHTPSPMGFLNEICHRPKTEKPFVLLVVGYPAENAQVPAHALIKKTLSEISTFL